MTEKEAYIMTYDREFDTTMKVLRRFPEGKLDLRPASTGRTARELMFTFAGVEFFLAGAVKGEFSGGEETHQAPATMAEILKAYENAHREVREQICALSDAEFEKPIKAYTGPGKMGEVPRNQYMWYILYDVIHHRGQFSVYLRMAGGKVPSIYGPSGDEPWM